VYNGKPPAAVGWGSCFRDHHALPPQQNQKEKKTMRITAIIMDTITPICVPLAMFPHPLLLSLPFPNPTWNVVPWLVGLAVVDVGLR
jgi:hypothetical protein